MDRTLARTAWTFWVCPWWTLWVPHEGPLSPWRTVPLDGPAADLTNDIAGRRTGVSAAPGYVDWDAIRAELGHELPSDYRHLIERCDKAHAHAISRRRVGYSVAVHPFAPEPGGALPWGEVDGGWLLAWIPTIGSPDQWPVVAIEPAWMGARGIGESMTSLIARYLTEPTSLKLWD